MDADEDGVLFFFLLPLLLLWVAGAVQRQGRARGDTARPAHPYRRHRHQRGRARLLLDSSPLRQAEDGAGRREDGARARLREDTARACLREDTARARRREDGVGALRGGGIEVGARRLGVDGAGAPVPRL